MGIQKLKKYVHDHYHDWKDFVLKDCPIVMDGSGLSYYLAQRVQLEWQYGGKYSDLESVYKGFFDTLKRQNVQPICVVFDGVNPTDKLGELLKRKASSLESILKNIESEDFCDKFGRPNLLPPLVTETFRKFLHEYDGGVEIYGGDEEADSLGVVIANRYKCPLLGDDSDYFISDLKVGYIPYDKLTWTKPGEPIWGMMFRRDSFAQSLRIDDDMVIAIPAIVGNDSIPNLVEETSLKRIRGQSQDRYNDTKRVISYIKSQRSMLSLKSNLLRKYSWQTLEKFEENLRKAEKMYDKGSASFDKEDFLVNCSYKSKDGNPFPPRMVKQFREFNLSIKCFEVLMKNVCIHRIMADDWHEDSCKMFSAPIRQEMYGIMQVREPVRELVREERRLTVVEVRPIPSDLSIYQMHAVPEDVRVGKLCSVLQCDPSTLSGLDRKWFIPVASVCYWAKTARISKNDLKLKALLLCFAECYHNEPSSFQPVFNVQTLHTLTQWQCVYQDSIFLDQVLALPLSYPSPAHLFDGKRLSYYYQRDETFLDERISRVGGDIHRLYEQLLETIGKNL